MEDNYIALDMTEDDHRLHEEYHTKGKLHPDFLPISTYDMVQMGYPRPDHGGMVYRDHGGTDEKGILQPATGMWMKVEDFKEFMNMIGAWDIIRTINTRHRDGKSIAQVAEELKNKLK
jgi:hypothetical protein